jgi:hypothetical protein
MELHNIKNPVHRLKREATEWEKIFARYSLDKELISRIYKEFQELNTRSTTQLKNGQMKPGVGGSHL